LENCAEGDDSGDDGGDGHDGDEVCTTIVELQSFVRMQDPR